MAKKYLIVNADDFGQSNGINRGIIKAHENGIVTSVSLMVRWAASEQAAAYCVRHPELSAGLHVDLGEWKYRDAEWHPIYSVVSFQNHSAVLEEVDRQIAMFRSLIGRKPTHMDSHQHVHLREPAKVILSKIADDLKIPLRHSSRIQYCGKFYGQTVDGAPLRSELTVERFIEIISQLPPGTSELCCHPAEEADIDTMYRFERLQELDVLCDARIRKAISEMGIELSTFHNCDYGD